VAQSLNLYYSSLVLRVQGRESFQQQQTESDKVSRMRFDPGTYHDRAAGSFRLELLPRLDHPPDLSIASTLPRLAPPPLPTPVPARRDAEIGVPILLSNSVLPAGVRESAFLLGVTLPSRSKIDP
jgi:hypothetical protein